MAYRVHPIRTLVQMPHRQPVSHLLSSAEKKTRKYRASTSTGLTNSIPNQPCRATVRCLLLNSLCIEPRRFPPGTPVPQSQSLPKARALADKAILYKDDDKKTILLVWKLMPPTLVLPSHPKVGARPATWMTSPRHLLMESWSMQVCCAAASCYLHAARTLSMLGRFQICTK